VPRRVIRECLHVDTLDQWKILSDHGEGLADECLTLHEDCVDVRFFAVGEGVSTIVRVPMQHVI